MSLATRKHYIDFESTKFCAYSLKTLQIQIFIVIGVTQPGLEPTIYHTRVEHANHYTTDAAISL
jgi:hypothetical protein